MPSTTALKLEGKRFGRLLVIKRDTTYGPRKTYWHCKCDCGRRPVIRGTRLMRGTTRSCGCWRREASAMRGRSQKFSHGLARTITGRTWYSMMTRCRNIKWDAYTHYGAKGIKVCERIASTPQALIDLIGERPSLKYSLDRKNNRGHYSCGLCADCATNDWSMNIRWATAKEQKRNTSYNRMITVNGQTRCCAEWAEIYGLDRHTVLSRLNNGWTPEESVSPVDRRKRT